MNIFLELVIILLAHRTFLIYDEKIMAWFQNQADEIAKKRGLNNVQIATFAAWLFPVFSLVMLVAYHFGARELHLFEIIFIFIAISGLFYTLLRIIEILRGAYKQNDSGVIIIDARKALGMKQARSYGMLLLILSVLDFIFRGMTLGTVEMIFSFPYFLVVFFISCRPTPTSRVKVSLRDRIRSWLSVLQPAYN